MGPLSFLIALRRCLQSNIIELLARNNNVLLAILI